MDSFQVAIDGPAGSGKSTISKQVASLLGFTHIDTGAMYRAVTLYCLERNVDCQNDEEVNKLINEIKIELYPDHRVSLNGKDVTKEIRSTQVAQNVSYIAANKEVRLYLVDQQRLLAKNTSVVMDGRDIGTYVLPNADVKIFQIASVETRAKRRYLENVEKGIACTIEEISEQIKMRDRIDSGRSFAPLSKADDAVSLDTSDLTIEEVVNAILKIINEKVGEIHE
jgi:cytidylate kinase